MKKGYSQFIYLFVLLFGISIAHCKKAKEQIEKNYVISVMTSGHWVVQQFTEATIDETTEFTPYEFQFTADGKVYGIEGVNQTPGTWVGDASALTIQTDFPAANDTLTKLNDTWKIIDSSPTMVKAKPTNSSRDAYLMLVKK
ncbi:MAG: hypothetical protein C5B52_12770 [Bacteroidetes bacterium]|nr:MAG: hypothetical protein C5B52_12770 [Bacteroidota bacterium]